MRKLMAFVAVSCCIASAGSRGAESATLSVDPKNSCFDLTTHQLFGTTLAFLPLANGKYTVSMTSTANLGTSGSALNKVYFQLETPKRPFSSLNIVSTLNPNNVSVNGNGTHFQSGITAFIVDSQCGDNTGTITMTVVPR